MFINLVNTDIPFEEYRLSRETIDALKYRLLESEWYLHVYEMQEKPDPFDEHWVYLLNKAKKLYVLVVATGMIEDGWSPFHGKPPLLQMLEVAGDGLRHLSDYEMIQFLTELYEENPDKPLSDEPIPIYGLSQELIRDYEKEVEDIVKMRRNVKMPKEDPPLHHYEAYENQNESICDEYRAFDEATPEERVEIERIMRIIMKKVYNIDY